MNLEDWVSLVVLAFFLGFNLSREIFSYILGKRFGTIRKVRYQKRLWALREATKNEHEEMSA